VREMRGRKPHGKDNQLGREELQAAGEDETVGT